MTRRNLFCIVLSCLFLLYGVTDALATDFLNVFWNINIPDYADNTLPADESCKESLGTLFTRGTLQLREVPPLGFEMTADNLHLNNEYLKAIEDAGLQVDEWLSALFAVSVSPSGKSAILSDGDYLYTWNDGKANPVRQNPDRGAADTNGNLQRLMSRPYSGMLGFGDGEISWSPDGKYAAITNCRSVIINMMLYYDPLLIDTETGDVFLAATYGRSLSKGMAGAPTAACFSRDGKYVYYMIYGNAGGNRTSLLQYDIALNKAEIVCSVSNRDYYPSLCELQDGSLMILQDTDVNYTKTNERTGIARYKLTGAGWMRFSRYMLLEAASAYTNRMIYSAASGYALTNASSMKRNTSFYTCFLPDENFTGLDQYWAFDLVTGAPVNVPYDEIRALSGSETVDSTPKFEYIYSMTLSPDGQYAIFHTGLRDSHHLRLVRLIDMKSVEVSGIDPEELVVLPAERNSIVWNSDILLIRLKSGIRAFELE